MNKKRLKIVLLGSVALLILCLILEQPRAKLPPSSSESREWGDVVTTGFWASEGQSSASRDTVLSRFSMNSGGNIYTQSTNYGVGWSLGQFVAARSVTLPTCVSGDANESGAVDIDDVVYLIWYIFQGGPPPIPMLCCGDANGSGAIDIDDVVYLIMYIFQGGPEPDPTACDPPWLSN